MQTAFQRDGRKITSIERNEDSLPKEHLVFDSINKAKKHSRDIQKKHGGLGGGYLVNMTGVRAQEVVKRNPVVESALVKTLPSISGLLDAADKFFEHVESSVKKELGPTSGTRTGRIPASKPTVTDVTYFPSRKAAREHVATCNGVAKDLGIDSEKGKRWIVVLKQDSSSKPNSAYRKGLKSSFVNNSK